MEIKKENILKAHENGCDDVKRVLEDLFPEIVKKAKQWEKHKEAVDSAAKELKDAVQLAINYPHRGFRKLSEYALAQVLFTVIDGNINDDHLEFREFYEKILMEEV